MSEPPAIWQAARVMGKAYSLDPRERVWAAWRAKEGTQAEVAARFSVSESFARDLSRRFRASGGSLAARPHGGGRAPGADAPACEKLRALVAARSDDTIKEHRASLRAVGGPALSRSALGATLLRLGLTRKKRRWATTSARASG